MEYCKYESSAFIRNLGSVTVFFWFILWIFFVTWFVTRVAGDDKTLTKLRSKYTWVSMIDLVNLSLLQITISALITQHYTDLRESMFARVINMINAAFMFLGVLILPVVICCTFKKKNWRGYE